MKHLLLSIFLLISLGASSQEKKLSDSEIKIKLDSIKQEANLMFSLENASWNATDIVRKNNKISNKIGGYLTYKVDDIVKTVFFNATTDKVLIEYSFKNDWQFPTNTNETERDLLDIEKKLHNSKNNLISQLSDEKYEVFVPNGFNLNIVSFPFGEKIKHYIITGATETGVIPFGNDYLFITDEEGKILTHKKFHSRLIPAYTNEVDGNVITKISHSHLHTTPFISATDICTFKLYAPFSKLEKFSVYSPALDCYFEYDYTTDTLIKVDK